MTNPLTAIERAQAVVQSGATGHLAAQERTILDRLIGAHRGATLTDREAAIGIAVISELRTVASKMNRDVLRGTDAAITLTGATA